MHGDMIVQELNVALAKIHVIGKIARQFAEHFYAVDQILRMTRQFLEALG